MGRLSWNLRRRKPHAVGRSTTVSIRLGGRLGCCAVGGAERAVYVIRRRMGWAPARQERGQNWTVRRPLLSLEKKCHYSARLVSSWALSILRFQERHRSSIVALQVRVIMAESPHDRPRLNEIIAEYLQALQAGHVVDRAELFKKYPHFTDELRSLFANHDQM